MPQQVLNSVENNFTKGLITEFTGLNFPENAATVSDNTEYTIIGDVIRRQGIDIETNGIAQVVTRDSSAVNSYKWNNAGGDGLTQLIVKQVGATLYFYKSSSSTVSSPLSTQLLASTINIPTFLAVGNTFDISKECQFADGNGYLFVFHPQCDTFYCSYTAGIVVGAGIKLSIRDFAGIFESTPINNRPSTLSNEHLYNLYNQGWTNNNATWSSASGSTVVVTTGLVSFQVPAGMAVGIGDPTIVQNSVNAIPGGTVFIPAGSTAMQGTVYSYVGTTLTINVTYIDARWGGSAGSSWYLFPTNIHGYISAWVATTGNYPSNADVWWYFKDANGTFNPAATLTNTTLAIGSAPQGAFLLNPFNQTRTAVSGVGGLTNITTKARPKNGCWFQGRVWYTGVDDTFPATGDAVYTTWTENIYFSQIVQTVADFGTCYQTNDPTSQNLFSILPSDGGVITIQGAGSIYKLFPLMNALLVFAANGVWYISGGTSVGFSADDYTIVKLSAVRSISSTSFVDINGLPIFWNEEGIYQVEPAKQGTSLLQTPLHVNPLEVTPITIGTILTFFSNIPKSSKQYARGVYNPIEYVVQWIYKDTESTSVNDRYAFNKILNYNTANKAFFPYTVDNSVSSINGIVYVDSPGGLNTPPAIIKYISSNAMNMYIADEHDNTFTDWTNGNGVGINYVSTFTTGFKLHGQADRRFQVPYVYVYSRGAPVSYYVQSQWDYASSFDSNRWSTQQQINIPASNFGMEARRHRLRGRGLAMQIKMTSVDGQPFDIMGWALYETVNQGM